MTVPEADRYACDSLRAHLREVRHDAAGVTAIVVVLDVRVSATAHTLAAAMDEIARLVGGRCLT
jgi:hypothetical protein